MQQQDFNLQNVPLSHGNDPATSHHAEASMRSSGALEGHNRKAAWLVARYPGKTASELWDLAKSCHGEHFIEKDGWDLQEVRRRLTTIKGVHAMQGEARMGLRKKREVTWWPK